MKRNHSMEILWSPLAVERLEEIYDYIARDNVSAAQNLIENIFVKVELLKNNSESGRKVPESNREEIRELFEGEYRIIYKLGTKKTIFLRLESSSNYYQIKI
ncbi:MAG: type II toxin-antitoxin system RelE/ParE family toxin [Melioribacteraceae bacterium]|nr:type II toxin-antitoxin system RelE/ParE family toxin [Melioribacteraceae bacterium]